MGELMTVLGWASVSILVLCFVSSVFTDPD
jgi:hypothetical protein